MKRTASTLTLQLFLVSRFMKSVKLFTLSALLIGGSIMCDGAYSQRIISPPEQQNFNEKETEEGQELKGMIKDNPQQQLDNWVEDQP